VLGIPLYTERQVRDLFTEAGFGQVDIVHEGEVLLATGTRSQAARSRS
jgi:hypothetical protein